MFSCNASSSGNRPSQRVQELQSLRSAQAAYALTALTALVLAILGAPHLGVLKLGTTKEALLGTISVTAFVLFAVTSVRAYKKREALRNPPKVPDSTHKYTEFEDRSKDVKDQEKVIEAKAEESKAKSRSLFFWRLLTRN